MKNILSVIIFVCLLVAGISAVSYGQKKSGLTKISAYSGPILKKNDPSQGARLSNLFNVKMHQSITTSFGSWGGALTSTIAFTNSMRFFFTPKLTGQVNVSLLTSPFSQLNYYGIKDNRRLQVALDAQLRYQISKNLDIRVEFRKLPRRYGFYPGSFYGMYRDVPFPNNSVFER